MKLLRLHKDTSEYINMFIRNRLVNDVEERFSYHASSINIQKDHQQKIRDLFWYTVETLTLNDYNIFYLKTPIIVNEKIFYSLMDEFPYLHNRRNQTPELSSLNYDVYPDIVKMVWDLIMKTNESIQIIFDSVTPVDWRNLATLIRRV